MKPGIARISLVVSAVLFFTGGLVLCYCPGWYALAAAFAGVAAWFGASRTRVWATACLMASIVLTAVHTYGKVQEHRHNIKRRQQLEQKRTQGTNIMGRPNTCAEPAVIQLLHLAGEPQFLSASCRPALRSGGCGLGPIDQLSAP